MVVLSGGLAAMFVVVLLCSQWHSWEGLGDQGEVGMGVGAKVGAHGVVGTAVRVWRGRCVWRPGC